MARRNFSIVHWFPELQKHKCGYCKQLNSNCSYGMWAECMSVEDYQNLIDRGWRRSGKYLYKSVMDMTCCPLYTIRCEALNFQLTKSQKKIIKRLNRFLSEPQEAGKPHGSANASASASAGEPDTDTDTDLCSDEAEVMVPNAILSEKRILAVDLDNIDTAPLEEQGTVTPPPPPPPPRQPVADVKNVTEQAVVAAAAPLPSKDVKPGQGADPSKPPCKKAKLLRLERKQQKLVAKRAEPVGGSKVAGSAPKSLEQLIGESAGTGAGAGAHQLQVRLVLTSGPERQWGAVRAQEYGVYRKYQMLVHHDAADRCTERQFARFLLESPLEIELRRMWPGAPTFAESALLFQKYQMYVHREAAHECDAASFEGFLVDTPLQHWRPADGPEHGYGSFHQQYWLDGRLIAVGVIDILPRCVSSVYFFYDPDYRHLTLGTYGSLYELYFARQLHAAAPALRYYYMGFYIHTCPKMRYKAKLRPSFLLCPETYGWLPVAECQRKLDARNYCRLDDDDAAPDPDACSRADLDRLAVLLDYQTCMPYKQFRARVRARARARAHDADYALLARLVGKRALPNLLVVVRADDHRSS